MKRSAAEAAETRRNILAAAEAQFALRGFADAVTADIAKTAGVTEGALFHHFRNKRDLFAAVVQKLQDDFHEEVERHARHSGKGAEAFRAGVRASLHFSQRPGYQKIVLLDAPAVLGTAAWRKMDSVLGLNTIVPVLRTLAAKPALADAVVTPMALLILGYLNEIAFGLARGEEGVDIDACLALLDTVVSNWVAENRA